MSLWGFCILRAWPLRGAAAGAQRAVAAELTALLG
jgi:hypothetical protein